MTAGYSLVSLMGPLFTIFLTPLYTRVLAPADYGVVDVSLTLGSLVGLFVLLGIDQALGAFFFDGDSALRRNLITTAALVVGTSGILAGAVLSFAADALATLLFHDMERSRLIVFVGVGLMSGSVYAIVSMGLRLQMEVRRVNIIALFSMFAMAGANILFVLVWHWGAVGVVAANLVVSIGSCGLALWLGRSLLQGRLTLALLKPLMRTGLSLVPGSLSLMLLASADRLLLTQVVTQTELGLYAIANKLASLVWVVISPAWNAWSPLALEMGQHPDAPRQYARIYEYLVSGAMWIALGIGLFSPEILAIFTRSIYVPAAPYALVLMICVGPLTITAFCMQIGLYVRKQTHWISAAFMLAAVANVGINMLVNPILGVWGAMIANIVGSLVLVAYLFVTSQRAMPVPYRWPRIAAVGAVYVGLILVYLLIPGAQTLSFKLGAPLVLAVSILAFGIVSRREIWMGLHTVRSRLAGRLVSDLL